MCRVPCSAASSVWRWARRAREVTTPEGYSPERTERLLAELEARIWKLRGTQHVFTTIGHKTSAKQTDPGLEFTGVTENPNVDIACNGLLPGEFVTFMGPSGAGKSTLLSIIGGLEKPTSGRVEVNGQEVTAMGPDGLARMLRESVAFIFQSFGLLPVLSAAENVGLPMRLARLDPAARERRAQALPDLVGLGGACHGFRPFDGRPVQGRAVRTWVSGRTVFTLDRA